MVMAAITWCGFQRLRWIWANILGRVSGLVPAESGFQILEILFGGFGPLFLFLVKESPRRFGDGTGSDQEVQMVERGT
ncbi:hypothetical protein OROGR_024685 [Orobanche gracilis]